MLLLPLALPRSPKLNANHKADLYQKHARRIFHLYE